MEKVTSALTVISEWVMNLFLLHLYWIGGTLLGGVVFGIVPATIALFSTIRQLVLKRDMIGIFQYYKREYFFHFKHSRIIDLMYLFIFFALYSYSQFIRFTVDSWLAYTHIFLYTIIMLFVLFAIYLIPVYIHYKMEKRELIKNTFILMITNMKWNLPMFLSILAVVLLQINFSVILLFFGVTLIAFTTILYCLKCFEEFELKQINL